MADTGWACRSGGKSTVHLAGIDGAFGLDDAAASPILRGFTMLLDKWFGRFSNN